MATLLHWRSLLRRCASKHVKPVDNDLQVVRTPGVAQVLDRQDAIARAVDDIVRKPRQAGNTGQLKCDSRRTDREGGISGNGCGPDLIVHPVVEGLAVAREGRCLPAGD